MNVVCPRAHATTACKNIRWAWQGKNLQKKQRRREKQYKNNNPNIRVKVLVSTDHSAQFLARNTLLEAEMDSSAA